MDLAGAIEYAIIGLFAVLAVAMGIIPQGRVVAFLDAHQSVGGIIGAIFIAAVVWIGYACSLIYQWVFNVKGGYESSQRPCVRDIADRYRKILEEQKTPIPEQRLRRLAYYAWAYAQEKDIHALSSIVIERIAKCWKRVHFLGANIVSLLLGIVVLIIQLAITRTTTRIWWAAVGTYMFFGVMLWIRWRQEASYVKRLERFIVAENWKVLETFLQRVDEIQVENF